MDACVILASASPRRRELMGMTGIDFVVDVPQVDETCDLPAKDAVMEVSRRKAVAAAQMHPGSVIVAADTLVSVQDIPLGKPHDEQAAFHMLQMLRGQWHQVYTGVCCVDAQGFLHCGESHADVRFCDDMTDEEIRRYIATGEPMDKAGAYALQGIAGLWVEEVRGNSSAIIGLPLPLLRRLLAECGVSVLPQQAD